MAAITINIPDDVLPKLIDALCFQHGYDSDKKVGESRANFAHRMLVQMIRANLRSSLMEQARETVDLSAADKIT